MKILPVCVWEWKFTCNILRAEFYRAASRPGRIRDPDGTAVRDLAPKYYLVHFEIFYTDVIGKRAQGLVTFSDIKIIIHTC